MFKVNIKITLLDSLIILAIFLVDRISKIYILKITELESIVDIYLTSYLNLYLIWNKGIAFELFSFEKFFIYQSISLVIFIISIALIVMIIKSQGFKKYSLILILGGALGNLFDRVYYSAVPDFIDFHVGNFHWFIFNVSDIFITLGVISMIILELADNKTEKQNND